MFRSLVPIFRLATTAYDTAAGKALEPLGPSVLFVASTCRHSRQTWGARDSWMSMTAVIVIAPLRAWQEQVDSKISTNSSLLRNTVLF